jgi:diguanylate cyclase (GGDEF)-like protein/PAS domain S-box-containing protein
VTGTVVLFRDISAEVETRIRLRQAEIAFSHLTEAVVVTDADARILAVNPAFTQITGYTEEEVLGKNPDILASGRHDRAFYERMWQTVLELGYWEGKLWNKRKDGATYPESLKITAVRDENRQLVGSVSVFNDITEPRAKEKRLRHLAYRDQLTGLYNRTVFMHVFAQALQRARDSGVRLAVVYIDVDRFKRINDTLGHAFGDALLRKVAKRIRAILGAKDVAARLGGDEFVVLIEDAGQDAFPAGQVQALIDRIRAPVAVRGKKLHVTTSVGISVYPQDGDNPSALLKHADSAMYLVKRSGRNACHFFTAAMDEGAGAGYELETGLRAALDRGELCLHYQPKIALADGQVIGVEALVRWQHPSEGLLPPDRFLGAAGETGLMQPLTQWVIGEVSRQCARWRAEGIEVGRIACNLDAGIYRSAALETLLMEAVTAAGITPADIEIEILETGMLRDLPSRRLWQRLVAHGFDLSIDDFGAGESSLARIKELPVRTLKIDRGFMRDLETNAEDRSIVHTIIAMTQALGKQALAQGVETDAQVCSLIEAGCDAIQGYWFSPPVPPEAIPDLVRGRQGRDRLAALRQGRGL